MPPFILNKYTVTFTQRNHPGEIYLVVDGVNAADVYDASDKGTDRLDKYVAKPEDWSLAEVRISG